MAFAVAMVFLAGGSASATHITFETGTYVLSNDPDESERLDNLFDRVFPFAFDFGCARCAMTVEYDGDSIDISGAAYGGRGHGVRGYLGRNADLLESDDSRRGGSTDHDVGLAGQSGESPKQHPRR